MSNAAGGTVAAKFGFDAAFPGLAAIAVAAFLLLWFAVPETAAQSG